MQKRLFYIIIGVLAVLAVRAQEAAPVHTNFVGLPLSMAPDAMMEELQNRGLYQEDSLCLSGRISGLDVWIQLNCSGDTMPVINSILVTTQEQQGRTLRDDYKALMKWMHHHYGAPTWESTVRGHSFARWWVDFDHDIVLIATAQPSVEVWFYDNHSVRNIDYYAILKCCERNPVGTVPFLTAQQQVTWKGMAVAPAKKVVRSGKKTIVRRAKRPAKRSRKTTRRRRR